MSAKLFDEVNEALSDSRRYMTEFGSVEPSQLVYRINAAQTAMGRMKDEWCYREQWVSANIARFERGEEPVSYTMFMAGGGE